MGAPDADQLVQDGHGGIGVDGVLHEVAEGLPRELVGDVQDLDGPPGGGDVELVVEGPDVVGMGCDQPVGRGGGDAQSALLVPPGRDPQSLFTPETLDLLAVELVTALPTEDGMGPAIAPPWMPFGECAKLDA